MISGDLLRKINKATKTVVLINERQTEIETETERKTHTDRDIETLRQSLNCACLVITS